MEGFNGIYINEEKEQLNISDHCLVRSWYNIGPQAKKIWKNTEFRTIEWIMKDQDSLKKLEIDLLPKIGKKINFNKLMEKIITSQNRILTLKH